MELSLKFECNYLKWWFDKKDQKAKVTHCNSIRVFNNQLIIFIIRDFTQRTMWLKVIDLPSKLLFKSKQKKWTDVLFLLVRIIIIMHKHKINKSMMTINLMNNKKIITQEKMLNNCNRKERRWESINDDLDSLFQDFCLGK